MQRDRAKKAKAEAKRQRRSERDGDTPSEHSDAIDEHGDTSGENGAEQGELSAPELLRQIEKLQKRYDAEQIDYEEYDEAKRELLARLPID
jgi:hypothetical protein